MYLVLNRKNKYTQQWKGKYWYYCIDDIQSIDGDKWNNTPITLTTTFIKPVGLENTYVQFVYVPYTRF